MIQEIYPEKLINHYEEKTPVDKDKIMVFRDNNVMINVDYNRKGIIEYITYCQLKTYLDEDCETNGMVKLYYLFTIAETRFFLIQCNNEIIEALLTTELVEVSIRSIREMQPQSHIFAGATAWHLYGWYRANRFCGACGNEMIHDSIERMMCCPECGNKVYPRINPAVIIGLQDGERLMMTKYSGRAYKNYALIAGFAEIGETIEETVTREVMEEVGLKVKNIMYYKSQPWGFDSDLLMGFFCELDGDDGISMDGDELAVAKWMNYRDIPDQRNNLSLTAEMMMVFKDKWS